MGRDESGVTAYVGLGSNLGDRRELLRAAVTGLMAHRDIRLDPRRDVASLYETSAVGGPAAQGDYLNSCVRVTTTLSPGALLAHLLSVERSLGRTRGSRWGPRVIDLDLLLYESVVVEEESLTLPHPRLHQRLFVLKPLCELAGELNHPILGETMCVLLGRCKSERSGQTITRIDGPRWCETFFS